MRFGMGEVRGVNNNVKQFVKPMGSKIGIVPFCGPPGIGKESKSIAALPEHAQGFPGIWERESPPCNGLSITIQGRQQLLFRYLASQATKALAEHTGRRSTPQLPFHT